MEELRRFALEGVSDELQRPSEQEQRQRIDPQPVDKDGGHEQHEGEDDGRNPEGVAHPVYRMLMTACVLRDPLLVGASTQHSTKNYTPGRRTSKPLSC